MTDTSNYIHRFDHASGMSLAKGVVVGYRYESEAGYRGGEVESWLLRLRDLGLILRWNTPVSGVWYSPSGRIYVALNNGDVATIESEESTKESRLDSLGVAMPGLFGLDDQHVYAYGGSPEQGKVFAFDGSTWSQLPDPPDWPLHLHGCAPDCLYAAARDGVLGWNGTDWRKVLGAPQVFAGIWVESPDEVYACGRGGLLFDGSADGWVERARWDGPLVGVARFQDALWLGGEEKGLLRLPGKDQAIECVKPKVPARYLDAREQLLMATDEIVVATADGQQFTGRGRGHLQQWLKDYPFMSA